MILQEIEEGVVDPDMKSRIEKLLQPTGANYSPTSWQKKSGRDIPYSKHRPLPLTTKCCFSEFERSSSCELGSEEVAGHNNPYVKFVKKSVRGNMTETLYKDAPLHLKPEQTLDDSNDQKDLTLHSENTKRRLSIDPGLKSAQYEEDEVSFPESDRKDPSDAAENSSYLEDCGSFSKSEIHAKIKGDIDWREGAIGGAKTDVMSAKNETRKNKKSLVVKKRKTELGPHEIMNSIQASTVLKLFNAYLTEKFENDSLETDKIFSMINDL